MNPLPATTRHQPGVHERSTERTARTIHDPGRSLLRLGARGEALTRRPLRAVN